MQIRLQTFNFHGKMVLNEISHSRIDLSNPHILGQMTRPVGPRARTVTSSCYKLARKTSSVKQPNFLPIEEKKTVKDNKAPCPRSFSIFGPPLLHHVPPHIFSPLKLSSFTSASKFYHRIIISTRPHCHFQMSATSSFTKMRHLQPHIQHVLKSNLGQLSQFPA